MQDRELVAAIVNGDPDGLAGAYDRYAAPLYAYCRFMLPDPRPPGAAADTVADTFTIATAKLQGLRDPDQLGPWLHAIARNECLRQLGSAGLAAFTLARDAIKDPAVPQAARLELIIGLCDEQLGSDADAAQHLLLADHAMPLLADYIGYHAARSLWLAHVTTDALDLAKTIAKDSIDYLKRKAEEAQG